MEQYITIVESCPICNKMGTSLLNLDSYPVTEIYQPYGENKFKYQISYDQTFNFCQDCGHGYLGHLLPREFIYDNYNTESSASVGSVVAIDNFSVFISEHIGNSTKDIVIDIGANDTTLLKKFKHKETTLVGIDPNISTDDSEIVCTKDFIENVNLSEFGEINRAFLCSHTLEHIFDPKSFLLYLNSVSNEDDEFFFQFPSLDLLVRDTRFDQVHHQHVNYFSVYSIAKLLDLCEFELISYKLDSDHYGAIMCYFKKKTSRSRGVVKTNIRKITSSEILLSYQSFYSSIQSVNIRLSAEPSNAFVCYGASLMLPILKHYIPNLANASKILDSNSSKFGLSYVNFDVEINDESSFDYKNSTVVITAISTKLATRKIVNKLISYNTMNIILPLNMI